jgi:hypothetical protein
MRVTLRVRAGSLIRPFAAWSSSASDGPAE